jgi:hypothetical protein
MAATIALGREDTAATPALRWSHAYLQRITELQAKGSLRTKRNLKFIITEHGIVKVEGRTHDAQRTNDRAKRGTSVERHGL